jgi:hypothetical protein
VAETKPSTDHPSAENPLNPQEIAREAQAIARECVQALFTGEGLKQLKRLQKSCRRGAPHTAFAPRNGQPP